MPYFKNEKILFLHIPKTGGTSIENYFSKKFNVELNHLALCRRMVGSRVPLQHLRYETIAKIMKEKVRILTVVRNPYERMISDLFFWSKITKESSKEEVFHKMKEHMKVNPNDHCIPQYEFIKGAPHVCILHTETLTEDMKRLGYSDFDVKANANQSNVNYYDYLNVDSIRLINEHYDKDFEYFKYKKIGLPIKYMEWI